MKILIAGDFCPQGRVAGMFRNRDFERVLGQLKPIISQSDYSIVNFECAATNGKGKPIQKLGPNLQCDETGIEAVKWAGFNCVTLANNHFRDYGDEGVRETIRLLNKYDIDTVGGGLTLDEASKTLYKEFDGKTIAIINCCEHEFTIATERTGGSNPMNPIQQYYEIHKAKIVADYVLVIVHGGHEHYRLPSLRMQETYRFYVEAGADAVVNHHQHCYSGYEIYKGKPIFYGIGNFCFDYPIFSKQYPSWAYGYMVEIDLGDKVQYKIYPYEQSGEMPTVRLLDGDVFNEVINEMNEIISDKKQLEKEQEEYYESEKKGILSIFQPFRSRVAFGLRRFGLMPSIMSERWRLALYNYIECESHLDKVKFFLHDIKN